VSVHGESLGARFTGTQQQFIKFLTRLAEEDDLREEYERNPIGVLTENGWELDLPDNYPNEAAAPPPGMIYQSLQGLQVEGAAWWPWIWRLIPWVG
jgi:hypothetical protein